MLAASAAGGGREGVGGRCSCLASMSPLMRKDHQTGNDPDHWSDQEELNPRFPFKAGGCAWILSLPHIPRPRSPVPVPPSPAMIRAAALLVVLVVPGAVLGQCDDRGLRVRIVEGLDNCLPLFQVTTVTVSRTVVSNLSSAREGSCSGFRKLEFLFRPQIRTRGATWSPPVTRYWRSITRPSTWTGR